MNKQCPNHLIDMIELFDGKTDANGDWTKRWFCPTEVKICRTPKGDFAGHNMQHSDEYGGFFGSSYSIDECSRCGLYRKEEVRHGGY